MASPAQEALRRKIAAMNSRLGISHPPTDNLAPTALGDLSSVRHEEKKLALKLPEKQREIVYNEKQQEFIDLVLSGKSGVLTGPAGSGKTTTVYGAISACLRRGKISKMETNTHKWLSRCSYSIACVAFTNKAVSNVKKALPKELHVNCMTIHKLLEFQPEYTESYDEDTGKNTTTMQFAPARNEDNPLPHLDILMIDEATMTEVYLWNDLAAAIRNSDTTQVILIGDIQQLPPVFGKSIFLWAMQIGAKTVELTHIYRQALESPIIALAHRILQGKMIGKPDWDKYSIDKGAKGKVTLHPWKKKLDSDQATIAIKSFLPSLIDAGEYDPMEDVVLTPFNKAFGTIEMNIAIASHLAAKEVELEKKEIWEIYAGVRKRYFRIGDKVLYNKSEAFIVSIEFNTKYYGKTPRPASDTMDYAGNESDQDKVLEHAARNAHSGMESLEEVDAMLAQYQSHTEGEEKISSQASHIITVLVPDTGDKVRLSGSGEINSMELGYALTVHKSQGSEYNRVLFITHRSQGNMLFRELLYTAVTRAKQELYVIGEENLFVSGITKQRVIGDTLQQKLENFERQASLVKLGTGDIPHRQDLLVSQEEQVSQEP